MFRFVLPAAVALGALAAGPALAENLKFNADLTGAAEVPPADSNAEGQAAVTVDTDDNTLRWMLTVNDLSGDATAAHIHGPAAAGENAAPVIPMPMPDYMEGSVAITPEQLNALKAGKYYVNVHTEKFPGGEIRGQLTPTD